MEKFCIIKNQDKDTDYKVTRRIIDFLEAHGKECFVANSRMDEYDNYFTDLQGIPENTSMAIVLGGDGTIIQAADDLLSRQIPLLGINLGTLGFLAEIEEQYIEQALLALLNGDYEIQKRTMLEGIIYDKEKTYLTGTALNDIVITRSGFSRIITVEIIVNGEEVTNYRGDGVIISTPTGSTGYNLSAGGPIIKPETSAIIITPICPHTLNARSIIVSNEDEIQVRIVRSKKTQEEEAIATFDGRKAVKLHTEDMIVIRKAKKDTNLVKLSKKSFFDVLRTKLGEGQK